MQTSTPFLPLITVIDNFRNIAKASLDAQPKQFFGFKKQKIDNTPEVIAALVTANLWLESVITAQHNADLATRDLPKRKPLPDDMDADKHLYYEAVREEITCANRHFAFSANDRFSLGIKDNTDDPKSDAPTYQLIKHLTDSNTIPSPLLTQFDQAIAVIDKIDCSHYIKYSDEHFGSFLLISRRLSRVLQALTNNLFDTGELFHHNLKAYIAHCDNTATFLKHLGKVSIHDEASLLRLVDEYTTSMEKLERKLNVNTAIITQCTWDIRDIIGVLKTRGDAEQLNDKVA